MNNELVKDTFNIEEVARLIRDGLASEEEMGLILRNLQIAMGSQLLEGMSATRKGFIALQEILEKAVAKFADKMELLLQSDSVSAEDLFEYIIKLQKNQVAFCEMQRRVVQSPSKLFPEDTMSNDEKKLLTLLKSFKTPEEKKRFLTAVETALKDTGYNEFEQ